MAIEPPRPSQSIRDACVDAASRPGLLLVAIAASVAFIPGAREFLASGLPDVLPTGDQAVLELGTWRALHGAQLLGPYSRFGWSHPGPAYFYLAAPFYAAAGARGPALNLFAFAVVYVCAVGMALLAARLRGAVFGVTVAALTAVYVLVGAPYLLANEWNPILPILPLAFLSVIAVAIALGRTRLIPLFAFIASAIVQTHVGFVPEVMALAVFSGITVRRRPHAPSRVTRRTWFATAGILVVCWMLPMYQEAANRPGNLELIIRFFVPKHWAEHSWGEAARLVIAQLTALPTALLSVLHVHTPFPAPAWSAALAIAMAIGLLWIATSRDRVLRTFARAALAEMAVAVLATRAIRGEIEPYLVLWISAIGLTACIAFAAPMSRFRIAGYVSALLILLSVMSPAPRDPVVHAHNGDAEQVASAVTMYLEQTHAERPTIRIASVDTWPLAAATVLSLAKHGTAVSVDKDWLHMFGPSFAEAPGHHTSIVFAGSQSTMPADPTAELIVRTKGVAVYRED